jgi:hypothetical protein
MKRERAVDRWVGGLVTGLVVTLVGFAAAAPRAERTATPDATIATLPSPSCADVAPANRQACLLAAKASVLRP